MNKHYVFSDLHGNYNLWKQIQSFLQEDDYAYCLGDCLDRGPDGIKIIQEIFQDNRLLLLRGNHENDFIDIVENFNNYDTSYLIYNGVDITLDNFSRLDLEDRVQFLNQLKELPHAFWYMNNPDYPILLCHSGISLVNPPKDNKDIEEFLYNREHTLDEPTEDNILIVHGHTPVQILEENNQGEVLFYCGNQKINIDLGTPSSGVAALLDLDTLEVHYFYDNTI